MKIENWLKTRGYNTDLLKEDKTKYTTTHMEEAAAAIRKAIDDGRFIYCVGDYDVDGICSITILYWILKHLGAKFAVRFPRKMSEGYGFSPKILEEIPDGALVLTIDNGIAAVDVIDTANSRGMDVVILDHHIARGDGSIPNASVIVDPHVYRAEGEFQFYCGAGLGYILAKYLELPEALLKNINAVAAIATVADVVPLIGDNRNIVKEGLRLINMREVDFPGLYALISAMGRSIDGAHSDLFQELDIAFGIGPALNAMSRIDDEGALKTFNAIINYKLNDPASHEGIQMIVDGNEKRKEMTNEQENKLEIAADDIITPDTTCLVVYVPDLHEGIIGINAARLAEKYGVPAIALTDAEEPGKLKGSARTVAGVHMKNALDQVAEHIFAYGGHEGAAGLTIEADKLQDFTAAINKVITKQAKKLNDWEYDIEIEPGEFEDIYKELRQFAPYGTDFPAPRFRMKFNLKGRQSKNGRLYYYYDNKDSGVTLYGPMGTAFSYQADLRNKYFKLGAPKSVDAIGQIEFSNRAQAARFRIEDLQSNERHRTTGFLV